MIWLEDSPEFADLLRQAVALHGKPENIEAWAKELAQSVCQEMDANGCEDLRKK